jgi:hypothetical protein
MASENLLSLLSSSLAASAPLTWRGECARGEQDDKGCRFLKRRCYRQSENLQRVMGMLSLHFDQEIGDFSIVSILDDGIIEEILHRTFVANILNAGGVEGVVD